MKKIMCILSCVFVLLVSGCSSYTRDTSAGETKSITVATMEKKMKDKETFVIVYTQSWCPHCKDFLTMLETYLPAHHIIVHDLVIDKDPNAAKADNVPKIQALFPSMTTTPIVYYVNKGEVVSELTPGDDGLTEDKFDNWVQKNKIDEKK